MLKKFLAIKMILIQVRILPKCNYFTEKLAASMVKNSLSRIFNVFTFVLNPEKNLAQIHLIIFEKQKQKNANPLNFRRTLISKKRRHRAED